MITGAFELSNVGGEFCGMSQRRFDFTLFAAFDIWI